MQINMYVGPINSLPLHFWLKALFVIVQLVHATLLVTLSLGPALHPPWPIPLSLHLQKLSSLHKAPSFILIKPTETK